jgi:hypothetical protein
MGFWADLKENASEAYDFVSEQAGDLFSQAQDYFTTEEEQKGFFDTAYDLLKQGGQAALGLIMTDGKLDPNKVALASGLGALAAKQFGFLDSSAKPTGYQGSIPEYTAVRERVPMDQQGIAAAVKPGASGRRYFSDTVFAQPAAETTTPPTVVEAQQRAQQQAQSLGTTNMAAGGLASLGGKGYYLGGTTDGMADRVPATIDGKQEARLSDGEFVVPADVVSHLGNGNSNAGAQQLYDMMDKVRQERTGRKSQGKQINPQKYMPA